MGVISYKCPNCSGPLKFDPQTQKQVCEYCESAFTQKELDDFYKETVLESKETKVNEEEKEIFQTDAEGLLYNCPSCGAQIVTEETTAATFCYYCHNPVVLSGRLEGRDTPDYVVPFSIDRKKAEEIFTGWLKQKKFVPSSFYSKEQIDKLSGVYFPYWLYSCKADAVLDAEGSKISRQRAGDIEYTHKDVYHIDRAGVMNIDNIARNALMKANRILVEGVTPFTYSEMQSFNMSYLSGFVAEIKDVEKVKFEKDVYAEVEKFADDKLQASLSGYTDIRVHKKSVDIQDGKWTYALMPVWTITYKDREKDKIYYFSINGQTGKVIGELPTDQKKLLFSFMSIFFPFMILLLLIGYFFI